MNIKQEIINTIIKQAKLSPDEVSAYLEKSARPELGDYSLACFRLAKERKKSPQQIAEEIASVIQSTDLIEKVQVAGGYVNIFLNSAKIVEFVLSQENIGLSDDGKGKTIVIDYSSPNIAKPFGIGHLRSTVIGNALYKIYESLGYKCVGINFIGDWGTQFGMLIADYKENPNLYERPDEHSYAHPDLPTSFLAQRYVAYNERCKSDPTLLEKARMEFKKLEERSPENLDLWIRFKEYSIKEFERIYSILDVKFDLYQGEEFYNHFVEGTIKEIEQKRLTQISEGALIVDLSKYNMPPCLLRKSDGATLYAARDIASAIHRYNTYKFHKMIYVVGSDQKLHFRQVFKVLELMGYEWAKDCIHVDFGLVRFKDASGDKQKMSTRKGTTILLEDVLEESVHRSLSIMQNRPSELADKVSSNNIYNVTKAVGIGAIIFNDLKNKRIKDVDFDWSQVLSFDGETGPYLQYTHTRLASLLEKYNQLTSNLKPLTCNFALLNTPEEIAIIKVLGEFPDIIQQSAEQYEPSILSNYLLNLSSLFNRYYQYHRIISDSAEISAARISLVHLLKGIFSQGLTLLGITPLEKM
ncbi:MAG: arginine--tRNA ligase [Planctomycetota bacterium]